MQSIKAFFEANDRYLAVSSILKMEEKEIINRIKKFPPKTSAKFFEYTIQVHQDGFTLDWRTNNEARIEDEQLEGKYLLYSSDPTLSTDDVVKLYFERDYVERVFEI
ncbi:hypothetical protein ACKUB1_06640 [Methanospirillum stamsii]|uniref:Uncharacterized protein n=1 Tax=Methanospirillum stamsii TaxID=1277351 RepID=A0A2V2NEQ4_9EURY|nr:hypothetical protein [Methanospirillum stamsii]PWR76056.1 hypothetical protein DLD82_00730 [Methanospirillum stamsii]